MGSRLEANSTAVRKRIENHTFENEEGEEYKGSKFGGFPEYFRRKKIKLQNLDAELRSQTTDNPQIFRGIVAQVNGFTQPSLNDLHRLIVSHGGGFMQYLDGKTSVTHIIASSLTPKKVEEFKRYRIVKPAWIVDSVKAGKLLPWDQYRVVDEGIAQKVLQFKDGQVVSRTNDLVRGYRDQTDNSWYTSQLVKEATPSTQLPTPVASSPPRVLERAVVDSIPADDNTDDIADVAAHQSNDEENDEFLVEEDFGQDIEDLLPQITHPDSASELEPATTTANEKIMADVSVNNHGESGVQESVASPSTLKRKTSSEQMEFSSPKRTKLTAEEHNAVLLSDPRMRKSSVLNPDFLEQYYRESRLHHLSAWKADLKSQLQAMAAEKSSSQQAKNKRVPGARRYILHVDFDSFFVAVSLKNHPQFVDVPTVVAHGSGPGSEIASCNYPARKFGIKNGMWMKKALELYKDIKVLPYDFPAYEAASRKFYDAILATGGIVQSVSIDEALVDVTTFCLPAGGSEGRGISEGSIWREQAKADEIAQNLRDKVKADTGCAVSVGIGGNILLAKVALRKAKPAGQYQIKPEDALEFLGNLEVQDLPGVAYSIGGKLEEIGIKWVKDIREVSKERLIGVLGPKTGEKMYGYARGIDKAEVGDQVVRKSVSAEVNWGVRFETQEQAEEFIESLCAELSRRLLKERVKGKQLTMKIMRRAADAPLDPPKNLGHGKCDTFNKSVVLGLATNEPDVLSKEALSILRSYGFSPGELRGLGVQVTKLEPFKATADGDSISSQRRLQFKSAAALESPHLIKEVAAAALESPHPVKDVATPDAVRSEPSSTQRHLRFSTGVASMRPSVEAQHDPIQDDGDVITPKRTIPAQPPGLGPSANSPDRKPLNILGTQFIMPTQVDPVVLAQLPQDIRSRLVKHMKTTNDARRADVPEPPLRAKPAVASTILPAESQLDMEALDALPEDVREEVLAHYATSPGGKSRTGQTLLPQSPRKVRTIAAPRNTSSRGRGRGRGSGNLLSRLKGLGKPKASTLTQANFVTSARTTHDHAGDSDGGGAASDSEISADFLAALPEDIRKEVLAQKRAEQLRRTGGLEVSARRRAQLANKSNTTTSKASGNNQITTTRGERILTLPAWPQKPSFTTRKLSGTEELRKAVEEWVDVFRDEGPYGEDVDALGRYLGDVVGVERDMNKAVGVVEWMAWVVGGLEQSVNGAGQPSDGHTSSPRAFAKWREALERLKVFVRDAVKARGLGSVEFDAFS